ncbi:MAG: LysR substrate-binding domain-containing protein [Nevskia sp.]|uniref:LysR substrate-binding domain-containing protein n=1 Tax=Nevskia sp. TaxID=1929292 RepID=UPI004036B697
MTCLPKVEVVLNSLDRAAQLKALRERHIDVGFNRFFTEEPDLAWEVIQTEPMSVVVPERHSLAKRASLSLAELAREPLVLYPGAPRPGFIDYLMRLFHDHGLTQQRVQEVDDVLTASALVASNLGLSLVTESGRSLSIPGIVHVPLAPADRATVALCIIHRALTMPRLRAPSSRLRGRWVRRRSRPAGQAPPAALIDPRRSGLTGVRARVRDGRRRYARSAAAPAVRCASTAS